jgi:lactoylglutathione lyase
VARFTTVTVFTADPAELAAWYASYAELRVVTETPTFVMLGAGSDTTIAFHLGEPPGRPESIQFHLEVDDVDATVRRLEAAGIAFDNPPVDQPWGVRSASCRDPAGHSVEFVTPLRPVEQGRLSR